MRDHIAATFRGLALDLERLRDELEHSPATGFDGVVAASLDLMDRLGLEVEWLRDQPLSAILDDEPRLVLNR